MPAGFVRQSFRRTIVRTAVGLVVFQAFTLGLASARLAAPALAAPAGVICHGSAASATDATPDEAPDFRHLASMAPLLRVLSVRGYRVSGARCIEALFAGPQAAGSPPCRFCNCSNARRATRWAVVAGPSRPSVMRQSRRRRPVRLLFMLEPGEKKCFASLFSPPPVSFA